MKQRIDSWLLGTVGFLLILGMTSSALVAAAGPKPPAPSGATIALPLTGSKWSLYDLGAIDKCGATDCGVGQALGTLPNNGGVYFDLPVAPDVPAGGAQVTAQQFTGTGLNDAAWIGSYAGSAASICVQVSYPNYYQDAAGWHDQFAWGVDGSCSNGGTVYQQGPDGTWLEQGLLIDFASYGGHTLGDSWSISFGGGGTANDDWRGYLVTAPATKKLIIGQVLTMVVQVVTTGTPVFGYHSNEGNDCTGPAAAPSIRPYFQSGTFLSTITSGGNRWWSNPTTIVLADGVFSLSVPLLPQNWNDTFGRFGNSNAGATSDFTKTIGNVAWIGVTMGGGCFFGHGVNVSGGTARVIVKSYTVQ